MVQLSSFLKGATNRFSEALRNKAVIWKLKTELMSSHNQAILYTPNGNKIEVLNLKNLTLNSMSLPWNITSIAAVSPHKWLIQNTSKNIFVLEKSIDTVPCPNILRSVDKDSKSINIGHITNGGQSGFDKINLSKALNQDIESPNRLLITDLTYANIVIGLPDLDSTNEIYVWPRNKRVKASSYPVVNDNGQIIRVLSSEEIPNEAAIDSHNNQSNVFNYLEIVDVVDNKIRYLPIPMYVIILKFLII